MSVAREPDILVEPMELGHVDEIVEIERAAFSDPWSAISFINEIEARGASVTRVALSYPDGAVVGYFVAWFVEDEVHLGNVAVAPESQGRGIGQRRKINPDDAVGEVAGDIVRDGEGEPRLADPAGAGQRQQRDGLLEEEGPGHDPLSLPPDEAGARHWRRAAHGRRARDCHR